MKKNNFTLFIVAITLGIGTAYFANNWINNRLASSQNPEADTVTVVVAAMEIPFGQKIEGVHVRIVQWPKKNQPEGSFNELSQVEGKIASQKILPSEVLMQGRIVEHGQGSTLSAIIASNKRAVTVRVNDVIGVAGFLLPGNHVDVLATRKEKKRAKTKTLLENVKVLAVDQTATPEKDKPVVVRAVTLELDSLQAEQLVNSTQEGTVQLVLRNPMDDSLHEKVEPVPMLLKKEVAQARKHRPASTQITVIRSTSVNISKVRI